MERTVEKGRAKINLTLDVTNRLPNGYHEVEMIMHQIDLFDIVTIEKISEGIEITCNVEYLPTDGSNIAYKAAYGLMTKYSIAGGVHIDIEKNIPVAAGLAGGSTNAAAVIIGMNRIFDLNMSIEEMMDFGVTLGADVPFCIMGGCCIAKGIGEELTFIESKLDGWIVVSKPSIGVSTKDVYEALKVDQITSHPDTGAMAKAVESGNIYDVCSGLRNVLEDVTVGMHPIIDEIKSRFMEYGAINTMMSGSGPTVFAFFKNHDKALKAFKNMKKRYPQSYLVKMHGEKTDI